MSDSLKIAQPVAGERIGLIDVMRSLSVIWVICYHVYFFLGDFVTQSALKSVFSSFWMTGLIQGHYGVDVFFVISGFLISSLLLREFEIKQSVSVKKFYVRRFFRIVPLYYLLVMITHFFFETPQQKVWANFCFLTNYIPFIEQSFGWTWSLAIEEQFYLLFPAFFFLFKDDPKRGCWVLFLLLMVGFCISFFKTIHLGIDHFPNSHRAIDPKLFDLYFDELYDKTEMRFGGILCGVGASFLFRVPEAANWISRVKARFPNFHQIFLILILLFIWSPGFFKDYEILTRFQVVCLLSTLRYIFSLLIAFYLLFTLGKKNLLLGNLGVKSWKGWEHIAELSYAAYLTHPLIILGGYLYIFDMTEFSQSKFFVFLGFALSATFSLSFVLNRVIEKPIRNFGKRLANRMVE